jgi:hypothetical protein
VGSQLCPDGVGTTFRVMGSLAFRSPANAGARACHAVGIDAAGAAMNEARKNALDRSSSDTIMASGTPASRHDSSVTRPVCDWRVVHSMHPIAPHPFARGLRQKKHGRRVRAGLGCEVHAIANHRAVQHSCRVSLCELPFTIQDCYCYNCTCRPQLEGWQMSFHDSCHRSSVFIHHSWYRPSAIIAGTGHRRGIGA